jgi:hypothetical protein
MPEGSWNHGLPWHAAPMCPRKDRCGPVGSLSPYSEGRWYGPPDATLFCPACGHGWHGTDDEIEMALVAEVWWNAVERGAVSEIDFAKSERNWSAE